MTHFRLLVGKQVDRAIEMYLVEKDFFAAAALALACTKLCLSADTTNPRSPYENIDSGLIENFLETDNISKQRSFANHAIQHCIHEYRRVFNNSTTITVVKFELLTILGDQ